MAFPDVEDIIENIVDELFFDEQLEDEDGLYDDPPQVPKSFKYIELALVSRNFVNPVRRNLYSYLRVEGPDRFMLLTGQLRVSPHLAKWVKSACLVSRCSARTPIDGEPMQAPGRRRPMTVSCTALKWFLDACPQLTRLYVYGGDFLWALSVQKPETVKLTDIKMIKCLTCASKQCIQELERGWLKNVVTFPRLKELDVKWLPMEGPQDVAWGIQSNSSTCTGLSISIVAGLVSSRSLMIMLRSMPSLQKLVLERIDAIPPGELKKCLAIVTSTLTHLTITYYHSRLAKCKHQLWENDTVSGLSQLKTLVLSDVLATAPILNMLPPRLEHLHFSGAALTSLPAPDLAMWLRRQDFPLRGILKNLEVVGKLRANSGPYGRKAPDALVDELAQLCRGLGIEWTYTPNTDEDLFGR
ncbi:hypothetical protein FB451DRAFT_1404825 [Mycena latifolia]|nr:hypothetical protein FB451DRAFT_1404825 [Mycena latifolia]